MKKIILTIAALLIFGIYVNAQQKNETKKFSLSIGGGIGLPTGDFGAKNASNTEAGYAKTGYMINANFAYHPIEYFGIASTILYANHTLDLSSFESPGLSADHWQYYGILAGPMVTFPATEKLKADLRALFGVTNVNSPIISYGNVTTKEQWAAAFAVQIGAGLRLYLNKSDFIMANFDYHAMKPKFTVYDSNGQDAGTAQQRISVIGITVGVGVDF